MRVKKTLHELRTQGFKPLKPDKIHLRCPRCGRKQSNTIRCETDPKRAFLVEIQCGCCGMGNFPTPDFFDSNGEIVDYEE